MSAKLEPRLTYACPRCRKLILSVYTAAQLKEPLPVARHRGIEVEDGSSIAGERGVYSANVKGMRGKGRGGTYLMFPEQDDLAVSCTKCGAKSAMSCAGHRNTRSADEHVPGL
jgi:hypothetical protein